MHCKNDSRAAVYLSESDAADAWSRQYRGMSEEKEYAAFIYSIEKDRRKLYYLGSTYKGMGGFMLIRPNVVIPFIYMYAIQSVKEWFRCRAKVEALIHTHPKPAAGFTYRYHSPEDLLLLKLPRINAVYVIPYENSEVNKAPEIKIVR